MMDSIPRPEPVPSADANEQRLADLEVFVRGVVHDLNNALNVMKTNLYLLRQRLPEDEIKITRPLDRISDQVDSIRILLEGHQSLYHSQQPIRQRLNLNEVVSQVVREIHIPEGYRLSIETNAEIPPVDADPKLISAALRALLRNSMRAMPGAGDIRIRVALGDRAVELSVEDSGPGIPAEILADAFEPFVSSWPDHAGLGLALVNRVALAHGGQATLHSSPSEGTRVTLTLPLRP